jgi:small subunit ribosomal protein S10
MKLTSIIKLKSYNNYNLNKISDSLKVQAEVLKLQTKLKSVKTKQKRFTVLKSPHVHKKAREQLELTTYTTMLQIDGSIIETKKFLKNLQNKQIEDIKYTISIEKN